MGERHQCVDCGRLSPPTDSGYTLISKEFGWRLTRTKAADGSFLLQWRCPPCWEKYKAKQVMRPWEPPRRPPPAIRKQTEDEERLLSQSGEYSKALYEEEYPPPSSRRCPPSDDPPPSRPRGWPPKGS